MDIGLGTHKHTTRHAPSLPLLCVLLSVLLTQTKYSSLIIAKKRQSLTPAAIVQCIQTILDGLHAFQQPPSHGTSDYRAPNLRARWGPFLLCFLYQFLQNGEYRTEPHGGIKPWIPRGLHGFGDLLKFRQNEGWRADGNGRDHPGQKRVQHIIFLTTLLSQSVKRYGAAQREYRDRLHAARFYLL